MSDPHPQTWSIHVSKFLRIFEATNSNLVGLQFFVIWIQLENHYQKIFKTDFFQLKKVDTYGFWLIWKRLYALGEGFGHMILAQTWRNLLWVTSGVTMSASHSWFIWCQIGLFFAQEKAPPCNIFDHVSKFPKEKNDALVPQDGGELAWHQVQPPTRWPSFAFLHPESEKWNGTDVMSHRASAAHPYGPL